jgi:hypothetical protein
MLRIQRPRRRPSVVNFSSLSGFSDIDVWFNSQLMGLLPARSMEEGQCHYRFTDENLGGSSPSMATLRWT